MKSFNFVFSLLLMVAFIAPRSIYSNEPESVQFAEENKMLLALKTETNTAKKED